MAIDPSSAATFFARMGNALKEWPLWLLLGVAISLSVFVLVPDFRALVPSRVSTAVVFMTVAAWVLAATKGCALAIGAAHAWKSGQESRVKFVVTPVDGQCTWGISKQADGAYITQISGHFMVRNRTANKLQLVGVKVVKPKINAERLPGLVTMRGLNTSMHGTAHVSGNFIPPNEALPASATVLYKGIPSQRSGYLKAVMEFTDADANRARVSVRLQCHSAGPVRTLLERVLLR